jgi:hypothetical protein
LYHSVIKFLQLNKAEFHTHQLQEDRACRAVLINLHHTTPIEKINKKLATFSRPHSQKYNERSTKHKTASSYVFIDLEPALNNKDIFEIKFLHYTKIKTEEPRANKQTIRYLRCLGFGHTKAYHSHPPRSVHYGDNHPSKVCRKTSNLPAKCTISGGGYPANYRGCPIHEYMKNLNCRIDQKKLTKTVKMYSTHLPMKIGPNQATNLNNHSSSSLTD